MHYLLFNSFKLDEICVCGFHLTELISLENHSGVD